MNKLVLCAAGTMLFISPAMAATDWTAASAAWRAQYRDLAIAHAAQKYCGLAVAKPVRKAMEKAREGLADALASIGPVETPRALVKASGGKAPFCANATLMNDAKATVDTFAAQRKDSGNAIALPLAAPPAGAPIAANAPTPVIDPNIALIRNCRQAVVAKLGKRAKDNDLFWQTYESCMKAQGAGWF